jgi:hypothetical protein
MYSERAGAFARHRAQSLAARGLIAIGAVVVTTLVFLLVFGWSSPVFWAAEIAALIGLKALDRFVVPAADHWKRGATGEEQVGAVLDALSDQGWRPIHDVSLGRGNIDHVLVGPGGIFTIETKSRPGRIAVSDIDPAWLRQAYAQRKRVERITDMPAESLLVFSRAFLDRPVSRQRGVLVLPARMLAGHLARREVRFDQAEIERLHRKLCAALQT